MIGLLEDDGFVSGGVMTDARCLMCNLIFNGSQITLSNGMFIHATCHDKLTSKTQQKKTGINEISSELWSCKSRIQETTTFVYRLKSWWNGEKIDVDAVSQRRSELESLKKIADSELRQMQLKLESLYDYWPETPPDWDVRREKVADRSGYHCQKCSRRNVEKHVHHKIPVSRGGSHRTDNLEYLCLKCHKKEHYGRDVSVSDKVMTPVNRPVFSDRLDLIRHAIDKKLIISFNYEKFEGDRSTRSIKPFELFQKKSTLCVRGFCYLRNEDRSFAIKRMNAVKIVEVPGKCSDKPVKARWR